MAGKKIAVGPFDVQFLQRARGEETPYFVARVYRDGVEVGTAENHGQGGSTHIRGKGLDVALRALVDDAARAAGLDPVAALGEWERESIVFDYAEWTGYQRGAAGRPLTEYLRHYAAALAS